jgi:hypothetical protein
MPIPGDFCRSLPRWAHTNVYHSAWHTGSPQVEGQFSIFFLSFPTLFRPLFLTSRFFSWLPSLSLRDFVQIFGSTNGHIKLMIPKSLAPSQTSCHILDQSTQLPGQSFNLIFHKQLHCMCSFSCMSRRHLHPSSQNFQGIHSLTSTFYLALHRCPSIPVLLNNWSLPPADSDFYRLQTSLASFAPVQISIPFPMDPWSPCYDWIVSLQNHILKSWSPSTKN